MHLALGTIYCWGNMTTYVTSYLRKFDESLTYKQTLLVFALATVGQAMTMFLGGLSYQKLGPRWSALIGSVFVSGSVALSSTMTHIVPFALLDGLVFGVGVGIAYVSPLVCGGKWMPKRKGLVNGIVTAGFGLGAFLFDFVITHMINPHNLSPCKYNNVTCPWADEHDLKARYFDPHGSVVEKVPQTMLVLGGLYLVLGFTGGLLLRDPPSNNNTIYEDGKTKEIEKLLISGESSVQDGDGHPYNTSKPKAIGPAQLICLREGWLLWAMFICTSSSGLFLLGSYKTYAQTFDFGKNDAFLSLVGSLMSVCNFFGRVTQGFLADKFGVIMVLRVMPIIMAILVATLPMISSHKEAFAIWCCLITFCYGGNFSLYPTATMKLFGEAKSGANYGIVFTGVGLAGIVSTLLLAKLELVFGGFQNLAYFMAALTASGSVLSFFIRLNKYR